jgi:hypothetical protein
MKTDSGRFNLAPRTLWLGHGLMALATVGMMSGCASLLGPKAEADQPVTTVVSAPAPVAPAPAPEPKPPAPKAPSAAEVALADGIKAYQSAQYKQAESQLKVALQAGLKAPADIANAHKHLAFIYCTSKRDTPCAAAFKAAKAADPGFALSKAEAGHPMWARTYKKALGLK